MHKNTLCLPNALSPNPQTVPAHALSLPSYPYPLSLHTTLIIDDLRDSFHLIYYLRQDGGCCAAASLLDL